MQPVQPQISHAPRVRQIRSYTGHYLNWAHFVVTRQNYYVILYNNIFRMAQTFELQNDWTATILQPYHLLIWEHFVVAPHMICWTVKHAFIIISDHHFHYHASVPSKMTRDNLTCYKKMSPNVVATSVAPDQPVFSRSLIRLYILVNTSFGNILLWRSLIRLYTVR